MVSLLDGEVNRTWRFADNDGVAHEVTLVHHVLTGARALMLDYTEVPGSWGTTSVFHSSTSMPFRVGVAHGHVTIQRTSLFSFEYHCRFDDRLLSESTTAPQSELPPLSITIHVPEATVIPNPDPSNGATVTWYRLDVTRNEDQAYTSVHRRFRDFMYLDEQVRAALSGHHLASSLPKAPSREFKLLTDHDNPEFIESRRKALEEYCKKLMGIPHIMSIPDVLPFIGLANKMREVSVIFPEKTLGLKIEPFTRKSGDFPALVTSVEATGPAAGNLEAGNVLSKVNGINSSTLRFDDIVSRVKYSARPIVLHFLQPVHGSSSEVARPQAAAAEDLESQPGMDASV